MNDRNSARPGPRARIDDIVRVLFSTFLFMLLASLFLTSSRGGFLGVLGAGTMFVYRRRGPGAALGDPLVEGQHAVSRDQTSSSQ